MKIKHLPCGLFPHIASGIQRNPLYPEAGRRVSVECRLDEAGDHADVMLRWRVPPSLDWQEVAPETRNTPYYTFSFSCPPSLDAVEYVFVARDHGQTEESAIFGFSPVHKITLEKPYDAIQTENAVRFRYTVENVEYEWGVEQGEGSVFRHYLNVYLKKYTGRNSLNRNTKEEKTCIIPKMDKNAISLLREDDSAAAAVLPSKIDLWVDQAGYVYALEESFTVLGGEVYGLGEKFDAVNQMGKQPLSVVVEQYAHQQDKTYFPIPFFYTEQGIGFLREGSWGTGYSFEKEGDRVRVTVRARCPRTGTIFSGLFFTGTPAEQIRQYTAFTGAPALPPKWAFGPWMSSNGWNTQKEALEQVRLMNELAIPATVQVLEAWSDEETFYIWNDAQYTPTAQGIFTYEDFTFPADGKWPDPKGFIQTLDENGVKLVLWQIPVVKYERQPHPVQLDLDEEYAKAHRLCIRTREGEPYRITEMWFGNSLMPDFTNPETVKWWFDKRKYLLELGVAGFKTDGGEFLFDESARLYDGRLVEEVHNDFPNQYEGAYHAFLEKELGSGKGVLFSRSGYTGGQKYPIHWAGDQVSEWSELRGQLTAGLSLGLSGVPFWGFDIGGFAGPFPSTELYLRSAAMAAFSPVMQFHSEPRNGQYYMTKRDQWNNDRSPWNMAAANKDGRIIPVYRLFANLRMNLLPYLWKEAQHCAHTSRPMMAHLVYDYPDDPAARARDDEYMLGRDLLVAPVLKEGAQGRNVYLPAGGWRELWSGDAYSGNTEMWVPCGLERIPVFLREGCALPVNLNRDGIMGETDLRAAVSNRLDSYEKLAFLVCGEGETAFRDEFGNDLRIRTEKGITQLEGSWHVPLSLFFWGCAPQDGKRAIQANGKTEEAASCSASCFGRKTEGFRVSPQEAP